MVSYHMEWEAFVWYQDTLDLGKVFGCDCFIKALHIQFGPSAYDDTMEALTRLKQT